ncbi:hypothetical protein [Pseudomonas sichuanensis]|uniref:hypothetical protein n=1 Tax=Pseudomonas sichuanensis TaxID=2213015 RepID=UPI00130039A6|nr:hypothetical protein [Pseudomonas sichuanensis]
MKGLTLPLVLLATGIMLLGGCTRQATPLAMPGSSPVAATCRQQGTCAVTGPETAQLLNNRYRATSNRCAVDKPAWQCTGVLLIDNPGAGAFWQHDAAATARGSRRLHFLRADLGSDSLPRSHGAVLADLFSAASQGKPYESLCSHPLPTTDAPARPSMGCAPVAARARADLGSCAALGVDDAASWVAHYQSQGQDAAKQCAFNAENGTQFLSTLQAHEQLGERRDKPVEVLLRNWDAQAPTRLAIQALVYDRHTKGALLAAQQDQRAWFDATGDWLPVVRMDLAQPADQVFGFDLQDQLYIGYQVAQQLKQRFANATSTCAGGSAAFNCNGVLFRSNLATTAFHAWDPSPGSIANNGVSFSYARSDVDIRSVFSRPYGFTFRELGAPMAYRPTLRCAYPYNAGTSGSPDPCTFRGECEKLGVHSVQQWKARYASTPGQSCAFSNAPAQFQLSIDVRRELPSRTDWNELMMAAWPVGIPQRLPIDALYYLGDSTGLPQAQFIQRDFYNQTQRFLPVVRMALGAGDTFSYRPADQLAAGAPATTTHCSPPRASVPTSSHEEPCP